MKHFLFLLTILILGCNSNSTKRINDSTSGILDPEKIVQNKTEAEKEAFESFFEKFKSDSVFQKDRILFPLISLQWEIGDDEPTKRLINRDDWRFWDFRYDDNFATRDTDAYTQQKKVYGDSVRIEIRGVDNGIYIDYDFLVRSNKWTLIMEKDYSN
jgi:hypothetical protein